MIAAQYVSLFLRNFFSGAKPILEKVGCADPLPEKYQSFLNETKLELVCEQKASVEKEANTSCQIQTRYKFGSVYKRVCLLSVFFTFRFLNQKNVCPKIF